MEDILKSYWSMDSKELETEAIRLIREVIDSIEDDLDSRGSSLDFNIAKSFEFLTKAMVGIDYDVSDLEYQFYTNISTKLGFDVATKKDLAVINALGDETLLLVLKNVSTLCSFTDNAYELIVRYLFILGIYDGEFSDIEKNVIDYWKQFSNITVGASIDLLGPQAEYVRNGTNYNTLEENYIKIKDIVDFNITSIVHMLNIFNLPKLQKHWIVNKKLDPKNLTFRALVFPNNMSLQVLPIAFKDQAHQTINQHINWLTTVSSCEHLVKSWHDVLQYMYDKDQSHLLSDFFRLNDDKDRYRNEKFEEVFPEFNRLRDYIC
jgi:hypothetical protein